MAEDRPFHGQFAVGLVIRTQPVGFVVRHVIAAVVFEGQVDKTLEHAIEQRRLRSQACNALVGVFAHQLIEPTYIDLVAGKPEFHFDLVLA
ncbi:hypothetical protein D9M71_479680 [compost metagenome]